MWRPLGIAGFLVLSSTALADQARDNAWRQDLNALATQLPASRLNFSSSVSPAVFNAAVSQLNAAIPAFTDAEIVTGLARIVALLNDPHTNLLLPQAVFPMHYLPLRLQWFSDGLFVTGATTTYARAAGARVVRIGSKNTDDAYRALAPVISHENDEWLRYLTPSYLNNADVLEAVNVIPDTSVAHVEFEDLSGAQFSFDFPTVSAATLDIKLPDSSNGFTPLYRRNTSQFYWYAWLESTGTLYFKYNSCQNTPNLPFTQFAKELLTALDSNPAKSFVIDLRGNTGGDSSILDPLLTGIQQRASRFRNGVALRVFVDEGTISSALLNAESLQALGYATLLGMPTGGTPNHYGNIKSFTLPNSRLSVNYSTAFFSSSSRTDALFPDIPISLSSADYFSRFDPVLAALSLPAQPRYASGSIAVVNAANLRAGYPVAPGSIAAAFGDFPAAPASDTADIPWPASLNGVQVLVNNIAAPLLAVRPNQINFQVPGATPAGLPEIRVTLNGSDLGKDVFPTAAAAPGLFIASGTDISRPGAILNEDNRLNGAGAIARRGEAIQIYGTGQGVTNPAVGDGLPGGTDAPSVSLFPTTVVFGSEPGTVLYSGLSPVLPGVWQINVRVPDQPSVSGQIPVYVVQGSAVSTAVTLWVEK
jgi:uncharacterized protein (TIGR03437 family)